MDRRFEAFKRLQHQPHEEMMVVNPLPSELMREGKHSEFWQVVKAEIDQQIRTEELRFLDRMARNYEEYLQAWSRRQALIAVLAIPETANTKG